MSGAKFQKALAFVRDGRGTDMSQEKLLKLYALCQQATEGPCNADAPPKINVLSYEKWKAHSELGKLSSEEARSKYVEELDKASPGWSKEHPIGGKCPAQ